MDPLGVAVQPVILCGGSGTRLWPLSRTGFPKQFLCLTGEESLFQLSAKRLDSIASAHVNVSGPILVAGEEHRFLVLEQLREIGIEPEAVLLEPGPRNTAAALCLAALSAHASGADPILVVTPSDHVIRDEPAFAKAMRTAIDEAADGAITILGVTPDRAETGYGYIECNSESSEAASEVRRFVEKPDGTTAEAYLRAGNFFWNAGIFVLRASVWLAAIEQFRPDISHAVKEAWNLRTADAHPAQKFTRPDKTAFLAAPAESIDIAVMERCPGSSFRLRMVPLSAGWSDVGAWDALWDVLPKDESGNAHRGDVVALESTNTLVHSSGRLVGLVGVDGLVVVETPDAVLVAAKDRSQDLRRMVNILLAQSREELALHRKVHRPWGWYDSVEEGGGFKVKRIRVNPHSSLSLQKHHQRAEHWIVVKGEAEVTCGDKVMRLHENQSTYIPRGEIHRLANPGTTPLEIIEVQSGDYLGEDDIVRYDDSYGRTES